MVFKDFALGAVAGAGMNGADWLFRVNVNYNRRISIPGPIGKEDAPYFPVWIPPLTRDAGSFWYCAFGASAPGTGAMTVDGVVMNMVNAGAEVASFPLPGGHTLRLEMLVPFDWSGGTYDDTPRLASLTSVGVMVE